MTTFADTQTRAANGNFMHVPLLGGTTANEVDVFQLDTELITIGFAPPVLTELISDLGTLVISSPYYSAYQPLNPDSRSTLLVRQE